MSVYHVISFNTFKSLDGSLWSVLKAGDTVLKSSCDTLQLPLLSKTTKGRIRGDLLPQAARTEDENG